MKLWVCSDNAHIFTAEAIRLIHEDTKPFYMYLAYQNVHLACGSAPTNVAVGTGKKYGLQVNPSRLQLQSVRDSFPHHG